MTSNTDLSSYVCERMRESKTVFIFVLTMNETLESEFLVSFPLTIWTVCFVKHGTEPQTNGNRTAPQQNKFQPEIISTTPSKCCL